MFKCKYFNIDKDLFDYKQNLNHENNDFPLFVWKDLEYILQKFDANECDNGNGSN